MKARRTGSLPVPCSEWAEKLADGSSDNLLTEEKIELARHLKNCPACSTVYTEYRAVDDLILGLPTVMLSEQQVQQLQEQISQQKQSQNTHFFENATRETPHMQEVQGHPLPQNTQKRRMTRAISVLAALLVISIITGSFAWFVAAHNALTATSGSAPTTPGSVLYTATNDGTIYAIRPQDGKIYWSRQLDPLMGSITVSSGMIFTYTMNRSLTNGFLMAVANNILYVDSGEQDVYAIRSSDDTILWHKQYSDASLLLAADANNVYLSDSYCGFKPGSPQNTPPICAVNARDGSSHWHWQPSCASVTSCIAVIAYPLIMQETIYFGGGTNGLYAVNTNNGKVRWHILTNKIVYNPVAG